MKNKDNPLVEARAYPEEIWLQFFDDEGVALSPEERTFCEDNIYQYDARYVLARRFDPIREEANAGWRPGDHTRKKTKVDDCPDYAATSGHIFGSD